MEVMLQCLRTGAQILGRLLVIAIEVVFLDLLLAFLDGWKAGRREVLAPPKRQWWAH